MSKNKAPNLLPGAAVEMPKAPEPIHITPVRAVGMIQADLKEAVKYFSQVDPMAIDAEAIKGHLMGVIRIIEELHNAQLQMQAQQGKMVQQQAGRAQANGDAGAMN